MLLRKNWCSFQRKHDTAVTFTHSLLLLPASPVIVYEDQEQGHWNGWFYWIGGERELEQPGAPKEEEEGRHEGREIEGKGRQRGRKEELFEVTDY